jgi:hypothetical protein
VFPAGIFLRNRETALCVSALSEIRPAGTEAAAYMPAGMNCSKMAGMPPYLWSFAKQNSQAQCAKHIEMQTQFARARDRAEIPQARRAEELQR